MSPLAPEITTLAVGFPYRYYQYSPAWFMHWPYDAVLGAVVLGVVAWLLSRAVQGRITPRQSLLLVFLVFSTVGYIIINSILIVPEL